MTSPRSYRRALPDFIASRRPQFAVTITLNRDATFPGMRRKLEGFHAELDHALFRQGWSRRPSSQRSDAIWFFEHLASNAHAHGLLTIPRSFFFDGLCAIPGKVFDPHELLTETGRNLAPSADCDVQLIYDLPGAIRYAMKDWRDPTAWVLASEFHSARSLSRH